MSPRVVVFRELRPPQSDRRIAEDMPRHPKRNPTAKTESVFLNIPYDPPFENLYLAYIAGVSTFGLKPRAALEIPSSNRRLDRILDLIQECEYSIHDLSRVELDRTSPSTPRFNMPFELGLTVALEKIAIRGHAWVVCESTRFRLKKSLTDLDGTDPYIHDGTVLGLFRELGNAFVRNRNQPSVEEMMKVYRVLRTNFKGVLRLAGAKHPFNARVFRDLSVLASAAADRVVLKLD
jgi:hypothetical protein